MKDQLYKGRFEGLDIAFTYAVTTKAVNEAVVRHDCDPAGAHVLGRAMTGALLSAAILPPGQRLNACWKYEGGLRTVVADAGQDGSVRSFISPHHLSEFEDAHEALYGELGQLQVMISDKDRIVNTGTTPISLHDVVNDLAYHYCVSDQVETGMTALIGFNPDPKRPIHLCQGWMIQALPGTDLERFDRIRARMEDPVFRELLGHSSAAEGYFEQLANVLIGQEPDAQGIHREAGSTPHFACTCTREKMAAVLRSIPIPDRMTMVKRDESVGIQCQFCSMRYELTIEDCIKAWNEKPDA